MNKKEAINKRKFEKQLRKAVCPKCSLKTKTKRKRRKFQKIEGTETFVCINCDYSIDGSLLSLELDKDNKLKDKKVS